MTYCINKAITATPEEMFEHGEKVWKIFSSQIIAGKTARKLGDIDSFFVFKNDHLLLAAVVHARTALSRWADYHLADSESHPSPHKLAVFFGKWVAKIKPIQVIPKSAITSGLIIDNDHVEDMPSILYTVNASFAAAIIRSYLDCDLVQPDIVQDLIYRLHYRDESELALSSLAEYMARTSSKFESDNTGNILSESPSVPETISQLSVS